MAAAALLALAAVGYLVPIGNRTFTGAQVAPFVAVAAAFGAVSVGYGGLTAVRPGPAPGERPVFAGEGAWVGLFLGVPLLVGAGGLAALGLADVLAGNLGGTGAVCAAPFLLLPAGLLLNLGTSTHQRPDGALVLRRGALWPRVRVIPAEELDHLRLTGRSNRGVRHWTLEWAPPGSAPLVLGSWRDAAAAKRALGEVQAGGGPIRAIR